jgi:glucose-6-phosphate 1-dehydrogenase
MVQNHMMQLLCLVAMEPPNSLEADSLRDEKLKVLKALLPIDETNVSTLTVRGQYRAGFADGGPVPGYLQDIGKEQSDKKLVASAWHRQWRWAGFLLSSQWEKAAAALSEIVVGFRAACRTLFAMHPTAYLPSPGDAGTADEGTAVDDG